MFRTRVYTYHTHNYHASNFNPFKCDYMFKLEFFTVYTQMLVLILDSMFLDVMTCWIISPKLKLFQINVLNNLYFIIVGTRSQICVLGLRSYLIK